MPAEVMRAHGVGKASRHTHSFHTPLQKGTCFSHRKRKCRLGLAVNGKQQDEAQLQMVGRPVLQPFSYKEKGRGSGPFRPCMRIHGQPEDKWDLEVNSCVKREEKRR